MSNKLETAIKRVQESPSSVFTKEDVLDILKGLLSQSKDQAKEEKQDAPRRADSKSISPLGTYW